MLLSFYELGNKTIDIAIIVAQLVLLFSFLKNAIVIILNGGSFKHVMKSSIAYLLLYAFFGIYPKLFDLVSGINLISK